MAIKSKLEIERKTEEFVKNRKSELDRILYFVKNNEKGMGYESAYSSLKSMAAGLSDLADIFKQWANDDRQGKLEESVKPARKSFKQYLTEATKVPYLLKNAKVGDTFHDGSDLGREYKITRVTPSKVYATCVKDSNVTGEYNRSHSDYNETDPQWAKLYTIK